MQIINLDYLQTGVCIDLDECTISFYRNGKFLGVAFDKLPSGQNVVYYPAISLAFNERIIVNFGSAKFKYPVEGYQSLEEQNQFEVIKANMLIEWLFNLILLKCQTKDDDAHNENVNNLTVAEENIYSNLSSINYLPINQLVNQSINPHFSYHLNRSPVKLKQNLDSLFFYLCSSLIMEELESLLTNEYIIETCLLKNLILYHTKDEIHQFLESIWSLLSETNLEAFFNSIVLIIANGYQFSQFHDDELLFSELNYSTTSFPSSPFAKSNNDQNLINFAGQKQYLNLFLLLIEHKRTR